MTTNGQPVCEGCGYDLTGLTGEHDEASCPECGVSFVPWAPFVPAPTPRPITIVSALIGPCGVWIGLSWLFAWVLRVDGGSTDWLVLAAGIFVVMWLLLGLWIAAVWPLHVQRYLTRGDRYRLPLGRMRLIALMAGVANLAALAHSVWRVPGYVF